MERNSMAILKLEQGATLTDSASIDEYLNRLDIQLNQWPIGEDVSTQLLLAQPRLDETQKESVLRSLDHYFESLGGYESRDLIVLNPETPNLDGLLAKFSRPHTHADDEVRYIVDGEGVFGFVCPDGSQMELTIQPEEYINVPAGTEHWFYLTASRRIKAVRYFVDTTGWTPDYTDTVIRMQPVAV
jgi:1,2-dihydroxy-3-keto-5-methylthiopentene dioxygenase